MVDLTNPSPLLMTHFELAGFIAAVCGVAMTAIYDRVTHYWQRS